MMKIYMHISGGLGNQMFQYALYEKLKRIGRNIIIDDYELVKLGNGHNGLELKRVFNIEYKSGGIMGECVLYVTRAINKLNRILHGQSALETDAIYSNYHEDVFRRKYGSLFGVFQSSRYFDDINDTILECFAFPQIKGKRNAELCETIMEESDSVSIHLRGGDYLQEGIKGFFGGICTKEYYKKAIEYVKTKTNNRAKFFLFTNDSSYAKELSESLGTDYQIIDWNRGDDDYIDMQLMSCCKHNIIANSTFSWWGAYLNKNNNKIVVAPSRWCNSEYLQKDIIPDGWCKIEV